MSVRRTDEQTSVRDAARGHSWRVRWTDGAIVRRSEIPDQIYGIVAGSTFKGVVAGLIVGLVARKTQSTAILVSVGLAIGALFAYLVTIGTPYLWEIVLPGSIVGLIVGFATAKYCGPAVRSSTV